MSGRLAASVIKKVKSLLQVGLNKSGYVVRRLTEENGFNGPPPIVDDPIEAIHELRGGGNAAFRCPINACVFRNGLSSSESGWNHIEATVAEQLQGYTKFEGSVLERYYNTWKPDNALDALLFSSTEPRALVNYPPYTIHFPWTTSSPSQREQFTRQSYPEEMTTAGSDGVDITSGFFLHGPVSKTIGETEHKRCLNAMRSIAKRGYVRSLGDVEVQVPVRGEERRYFVCHGHHRIGAMSALGCSHVPAQIRDGAIVRIDEVDYWPQVRRGVWPKQAAIDYFNHLFDFDSRAWAKEHGLLVRTADTTTPSDADDPQPEREALSG